MGSVVVVGGGIAGLTAAFRLRNAGCEVTVLERAGAELLGGRMGTLRQAGFSIDVGATLLPSTYRAMLKLVADVGASHQLLPAADDFGFLRDGSVLRLASGVSASLLRNEFLRGFTAKDRLKAGINYLRMQRGFDWCDMSKPAGEDADTLLGHARRHGFSNAAFEYLLAPAISGITLADPDVSAASCAYFYLRILFSKAGGFTSTQGASFLPRALAEHVSVEHNAEVRSVRKLGSGAEVSWTDSSGAERTRHVDSVVIAAPPGVAADVYPQLPRDVARYLRGIQYTTSIHTAFALDRPTAEKSLVLVVPRPENPAVAGYVLEHNHAVLRVPPGKGLVVAYMRSGWAEENWDRDDGYIVERVREETAKLRILPEIETDLGFARVVRVRQAIVDRRPGELSVARSIAPALHSQHPVFFAGSDYLGYSSTNGSLVSGERTAAKVVEYLRSR
ncbi:NAD(P)/FAD-dependent oxidoreductase [Amycolatopsis sp. cg5]|uniref:protoporphyrinogen/coproporphyrinogen oxidase n=1 Tax=Amycolatopsis sp. cg5 TaxID=3238802 RepID=UPI00352500CD